jgi:hypothetical protein
MKFWIIVLATLGLTTNAFAQTQYWQQEIKYDMEVVFHPEDHQFDGIQNIIYINNSPDTLHSVYFHLYLNAFQPKSMMDERSRNLPDPDDRVGSRILGLKKDEIGFQHMKTVTSGTDTLEVEVNGTLMEVRLNQPLAPGGELQLRTDFHAQVPVQIRRTGRDNKEGVDYSMTQWYPKMAEYDYDGWNLFPYIAREFHGVWGEFDVRIDMPAEYTIAATGTLQNPDEIGHGYNGFPQGAIKGAGERLVWHFNADRVHDFAWAADTDYTHEVIENENGPNFHLFYLADSVNVDNWKEMGDYAVQCADIMNEKFGVYPYGHYNIVQGGDGGMEYPMLTLIVGDISKSGLISVMVHEFLHSWYQGVIATNEALYPWMDEGFTQYAQMYVLAQFYDRDYRQMLRSMMQRYNGYASSDIAEPLSILADHYETNAAYGTNSYVKGAVLLHQLNYLFGEELFFEAMQNYFNQWKFKHPNPRDFKRVMEQTSGLELEWFFNYFLYATQQIDYGISNVEAKKKQIGFIVERLDIVPMPVKVVVEYEEGDSDYFYIPLNANGVIQQPELDEKWEVLSPWNWVSKSYYIEYANDKRKVKRIVIDPDEMTVDSDRSNNVWPEPKESLDED